MKSANVRRSRLTSPFFSALLGTAALTILVGLGSPARADTHELRVLTWNTWMVPMVSDNIEERVPHMAPAIVELEPDLVALQEVWVDEHAEHLIEELRELGLPYARHWRGEGNYGGLLIASRHPFEEVGYSAFTLGRTTEIPWHVDWMADKGVARVRVRTPGGDVDFANTHLQARYRMGNYSQVRSAQALELARWLTPRGGGRRVPSIIGGDFNSRTGELTTRLLQSRANLADATPGRNVDKVLVRSGDDTAVRVVDHRRVLDQVVQLEPGLSTRLSDHGGYLVNLELSRCEGCGATPAGVGPGWPDVRSQVRALWVDSVDRTRAFMWITRSLAVLLLLAGMLLLYRFRPRISRAAIVAVAVTVAVSWLGFAGFWHSPTELSGMEQMLVELDADGAGEP